MKMLQLWVLGFFLAGGAVLAADRDDWGTDYKKALEQAKSEKKWVLIDFTGSDWCGYCIKLDQEVFSKGAFRSFSKKNLVLFEADFPRKKTLPEETKQQNDKLRSEFSVSGYPTIVLVDGEGKEQARWVGYNKDLLRELRGKVPKGKEE